MKIETMTKYKCDGCGQEQTVPSGWVSIHPLMVAGRDYAMTTGGMSCDYCSECDDRMRAALSRS